MKNLKQSIVLLSIVAVSFTACKKNEGGSATFNNRSTSAADYSQSSLPVVAVSGDITNSVTWTAGNVYELSGVVTVRNGATLTIEAGTYIKSSVNTSGLQNGILVIAKNGTINAVGTYTDPIVFTSRYLLDDNANTMANPGDFGGIIILGNAKINAGYKLIEGLTNQPKFYYGGNNDDDNRGTLQYVRIEYAGFVLAQNQEVNSLTLGGVGSGTTIDHVQVSYGLDDGFEFFGGTVSPSNLVALASHDDQFDFDNGYTGVIADAIAIADKNSWHSTSGGNSDSNGIESDNNTPAEDATFSLTPKTHPILVNVSVFGTENTNGISGLGYRNGIRERRGSEATLADVIVSGYSKGISFDADANANLSDLNSTSVHGFTNSITSAIGAYVDGGGNTLVVNAVSASSFGVPQPWYNTPGSPSTVTLPSWANSWTKLVF
ncbi:hypothetical protein EV200_106228 [Pedobacter psychrotolerans]|uniref:T9SS C-terminal target domain-containing protein n=1 Tax=Pedobacter psychrotolerans TaxID=1843235 RepID=A0A4R2H7U6_9SPHI|nr:hypothetical protein [Pedobacter psychrotolerans]TCO22586.1 hypothetical protein EV200_106228 [Pedobacter psychrotolerans]GGE65687.1 hypothetical protein GCM10011413_35210 [Pedobacter psychrotolerans]